MANRKGKDSGRRRRRGRRASGLFYKLLSFAVICVALVMAMIIFFKAEKIEVTGSSRYSETEIIKAAGVSEGDNLFLLNKFSMANRIFKKLPYINEVQISRGLPDTLKIEVTECVPAAVIAENENNWIIDKDGKILENVLEGSAAQNTHISGAALLAPTVGSVIAFSEQESVKQAHLIELLNALSEKEMLGDVQTIGIESQLDLYLGYDGRFTVRIAVESDYSYKLEYLIRVVEQLAENERGTIDLSGDAAYFIPA